MIPRMTTVGTLKNYRYNLNRSNNNMVKAMNTVETGRLFNSYAEDPALATRCFQLRRSFQRTASQLTVNDSLKHKYDVGWSTLEECSQDIYSITRDADFGSIICSLNGATASARNALGQSMVSKAKSIVQAMNGRYGENYVFAGADTLNAPFTWEEQENPAYIDPEIAREKLAAGNLTAEEQAKYESVFQYVDAAGNLTNDITQADTVPEINPEYDNTLAPGDPGYKPQYIDKNTGDPTDVLADAKMTEKTNPAYNEETACKYLRQDGTATNVKSEAQTVLCYRGVPVDAKAGTKDGEKLDYFLNGEKKELDIGLGHKEVNGEAVSSTVFDSALQGIYYLCGTGTEMFTGTVGEGEKARTVTREVPNNIVSIMYRMGEILQRCSNEDGSFSGDEEEEFCVLAQKFEDQVDLFIQRRAEMDTESGFLRDNSQMLTETAESLSEQFLALEDEDPAAAISYFMFAKYAYDTALKVGNSVLSQSLMDYLNL